MATFRAGNGNIFKTIAGQAGQQNVLRHEG
jgi:hypothetical protein